MKLALLILAALAIMAAVILTSGPSGPPLSTSGHTLDGVGSEHSR